MQTWEYMIVKAVDNTTYNINGENRKENLYSFLNTRGREGWEVVGCSSDAGHLTIIMKRPK